MVGGSIYCRNCISFSSFLKFITRSIRSIGVGAPIGEICLLLLLNSPWLGPDISRRLGVEKPRAGVRFPKDKNDSARSLMRGVDIFSNQFSLFGDADEFPPDLRLDCSGLGIFIIDRRSAFILVDEVTTIRLLLDRNMDLDRSIVRDDGS